MNPDEELDHWLTEAWSEHHGYLVNLAFRMLGDIGESEDVVQEAFARWLRAGRHVIEDERGWLIVVTSRLCLDVRRSARARRERPQDANDLDSVEPRPALAADPADRVTLDDSVRLALLVMLERLTPAERVVFVLHDMFQMPFEDVAETVGRSAPACRQLARRARQHVEDASSSARFRVEPAAHALVTEKFIAACTGGDLSQLLEVLDEQVVGDVDLIRMGGRATTRVVGAHDVARNLLRYWSSATLVSQPINEEAAILAFRDRHLAGVLVLGIEGDRVEHVHLIADPAKLAFLSSRLPVHV